MKIFPIFKLFFQVTATRIGGAQSANGSIAFGRLARLARQLASRASYHKETNIVIARAW